MPTQRGARGPHGGQDWRASDGRSHNEDDALSKETEEAMAKWISKPGLMIAWPAMWVENLEDLETSDLKVVECAWCVKCQSTNRKGFCEHDKALRGRCQASAR